MENNNKRKNKLLILASIGVFLIVLAILFVPQLINQLIGHKNPYGSGIKIANIKEVLNDIPQDYVHQIEVGLGNIFLKNNSEELSQDIIGSIRTSTIKEQNEARGRQKSFAYSFVIDIESRKQSYSVSVNWIYLGDKLIDVEYPVVVSCISDEDEIIYSNFSCSDNKGD